MPATRPARPAGRTPVRAVNGRWARYYLTAPTTDTDPLCVTYHRRIRGKLRQLTISAKLMRQVLSQGH